MPPVGGPLGGADDDVYENQLPRIDHGLFTVDMPSTPAVIGEAMGAQS